MYAELQAATHFSFLRGASGADELFAAAAVLGLPALGICDRNSLAGMVRAFEASRTTGVRLVVGCHLDLADAPAILVYPTDRSAYGRLCRLLTIGNKRAGKGACHLAWQDLAGWSEGLIGILLPGKPNDTLTEHLDRFRALFGDRAHLALTFRRRPNDAMRLERLSALAAKAGVQTVATGDVLYHAPERRMLQQVMTCIREGCTIDQAGYRLERTADRHLKGAEEIARLFRRYPAAVERSLEIVKRCKFSLDELQYQYPAEVVIPGMTAQQALEHLTWEAAPERYPGGVPTKVENALRHEFKLIGELGYAPYFLTVHSIVRFARSKGILCQGRGSAANSAVCYVLGITSVDPSKSDLLFERFVSNERREPPDIDVDFEHERREEVIQWIYENYGRHRAALVATVTRYRAKGAVREVGKVMGLPEDVTAGLAGLVWGWSEDGVGEAEAKEMNLNLDDRRLRLTLELAHELIGTPRHLSQHPGGFVLTDHRLDELVPIEPAAMVDRAVIQWNKDDIDVLKMMKVDVLGLGMLGCLRRCFDLLEEEKSVKLDMASVPQEDAATYAMCQRADTLGTFQIESRAQMAMLPRLAPKTFYDLVIQVAIIRPGPIQGDMVHPYLRRREGKEPVEFPRPELAAVLGKTLGVPLFQEQAMRVAIECAGFSGSEADQLRRAMATFKFTGGVSHFREKLVAGMVERGYAEDFAERTFKQLEGFGSYGFPESHAASFAYIAYISAWMKCHHPDVFCAALLNAQPMGFYAPAQIVRDARQHGIEVRPIDVNCSRWDCTLEPTGGRYSAVRLGLRMTKGLANKDGASIVAARADRPFVSIDELWRRSQVPVAALQRLAAADAFSSLRLDRRQADWAIRALRDEPLPLFAAADERAGLLLREVVEPPIELTPMTAGAEVVEDYGSVGLSLRQHPVAFIRADLDRKEILPAIRLAEQKDGRRVRVAGLVLVRQKPASAKGVLFITIEDETAIANLIVWPTLFDQQRRIILSASMLGVRGRVQREGQVIHVVCEEVEDLTPLLRSVGGRDVPAFLITHGRGDQPTHPGGPDPRDELALGGRRARDMYSPDLRLGSGVKVPTRDFR
ncbi:error-prone DNA polymerase 2 [Aliidongia dinghuensis]|uniref:Error-prone DNA polymerase n=1 Tax=Aliidongia dinghuensis TaxID=1867774 RepID=A0A8J3E3Q6_9PROT|nr:error-prone DNA polymerase [Aliidongia dinghuensis]GGF18074.1 error-prone DNA polymerase 2 [Aliidongia dinghuensis]